MGEREKGRCTVEGDSILPRGEGSVDIFPRPTRNIVHNDVKKHTLRSCKTNLRKCFNASRKLAQSPKWPLQTSVF